MTVEAVPLSCHGHGWRAQSDLFEAIVWAPRDDDPTQRPAGTASNGRRHWAADWCSSASSDEVDDRGERTTVVVDSEYRRGPTLEAVTAAFDAVRDRPEVLAVLAAAREWAAARS